MQLLDEMIDNGFPLTTEPNILRQMIAPPNIVSKVLSVVTGNSSTMSSTLPGASASNVPWRTTELKHVNNEVYVDLREKMDATVSRYYKNFLCLFNFLALTSFIYPNAYSMYVLLSCHVFFVMCEIVPI